MPIQCYIWMSVWSQGCWHLKLSLVGHNFGEWLMNTKSMMTTLLWHEKNLRKLSILLLKSCLCQSRKNSRCKHMTTRYVLLVKYASYQLMFISDTQFASALV
jgi:hypothetical protein